MAKIGKNITKQTKVQKILDFSLFFCIKQLNYGIKTLFLP